MIDDTQLREIETYASSLTRMAGKILLDSFEKPLDVEYKSDGMRNPVTSVDKRIETYLRESISREFSDHGILAEEGSHVEPKGTDIVWVIDPLDGTVNFLNGLPVFAISVGVLHRGQPIVGSIFTPSIKDSEGSVFHARENGGAFKDGEQLLLVNDPNPQQGRISIFPASLRKTFNTGLPLKQNIGEIRNYGSVAYELAMTASGCIQYSMFKKPWLWDVAAGIRLVLEAGGMALFLGSDGKYWEQFGGSLESQNVPSTLASLKAWRTDWIFANMSIAKFVSENVSPRSSLGLLVSRLFGTF